MMFAMIASRYGYAGRAIEVACSSLRSISCTSWACTLAWSMTEVKIRTPQHGATRTLDDLFHGVLFGFLVSATVRPRDGEKIGDRWCYGSTSVAESPSSACCGAVDERDLPGRQGRLAFVRFCLEQGRPVSSERLIDCLWGDERRTTPRGVGVDRQQAPRRTEDGKYPRRTGRERGSLGPTNCGWEQAARSTSRTPATRSIVRKVIDVATMCVLLWANATVAVSIAAPRLPAQRARRGGSEPLVLSSSARRCEATTASRGCGPHKETACWRRRWRNMPSTWPRCTNRLGERS